MISKRFSLCSVEQETQMVSRCNHSFSRLNLTIKTVKWCTNNILLLYSRCNLMKLGNLMLLLKVTLTLKRVSLSAFLGYWWTWSIMTKDVPTMCRLSLFLKRTTTTLISLAINQLKKESQPLCYLQTHKEKAHMLEVVKLVASQMCYLVETVASIRGII